MVLDKVIVLLLVSKILLFKWDNVLKVVLVQVNEVHVEVFVTVQYLLQKIALQTCLQVCLDLFIYLLYNPKISTEIVFIFIDAKLK